MDSLDHIAESLMQRLSLRYEPVGVRIYRQGEFFPEGRTFSDTTVKSYCHALMRAAEGDDLFLDKGGLGCRLGTSALGMEEDTAPLLDDGILEKYGVGLFGTEEASAETITNAELLEEGSTSAVRVAPLALCSEIPDVIVFTADPEQIMWILYAVNYDRGGMLPLPQSGGALGGCSDITVYPLVKQQANVTFLGLGCRLKSLIPPDHLMMGLPGSLLRAVHEHIVAMEKPMALLKKASSPR